MNTKQIHIYTDGACSGNPGPGGFGYVIIMNDKEYDRSEPEGYRRTTNNRMEIQAVIEAIHYVRNFIIDHFVQQEGRDIDIKITVFSDSQLVINTINQGWARKSNNDLWEKLDAAVTDLPEGVSVTFSKVKGHSGIKDWNALADSLAVKSCRPENIVRIDETYEAISPIPTNNDNRDTQSDTNKTLPEDNSSGQNIKITDIMKKGPTDDPWSIIEVRLSNGCSMKVTVNQTKW